MSAGIDYGLGRTNIDQENGIRFGCISQHSVAQAWADSSEADYGKPTCPKCGGDVVDAATVNNDPDETHWPRLYSHGCEDYACENCEHYLDSGDVFPDEPQGYFYDGDGYQAVDCLDSAILITKAPFYTLAPFCSPCVPGAGDLDNASTDGIKAYCFGHDFFDDGVAPYPIYDVVSNALVLPADEIPIGAIMPDGTYIDNWDERLRAAGGSPVYGKKQS